MLTTRPEIVAYLVAQGKPQNLARVVVEECFNIGETGAGHTGNPDIIWAFEFDSKIEPIPGIKEGLALEMYDSMVPEFVQLGHNCIIVCDEKKYDMNGDLL